MVSAGSVGSVAVAGPGFSVPFEPVDSREVAPPLVADQVDVCFLESGPDLRALEDELSRAVVVTVVGARDAAGLASVAGILVREFELALLDMSIRGYFLVLCRSSEIRSRLLRRGRADTHQFDLMLAPWSRHSHTTAITMPFLVPLVLRGIPANAWTRRTAEVLLHGLGIVVKFGASTAERSDMAGFLVWLRTDDPTCIPSRRIFTVEEAEQEKSRCCAGGWMI